MKVERSIEPDDLRAAQFVLNNLRLIDPRHCPFIRAMVDEISKGQGMTKRQRRYLANLCGQILTASDMFRGKQKNTSSTPEGGRNGRS